MRSSLRFLQKIEDYIVITAFIVMVASSFAQVINRNFIGLGISWFEELSRYCMIYMALLATEMGLRDGTQISVTMVVDKFSPNGRKLLKIFSKSIVVIFSAIVFYTSLLLLQKQISFGAQSSALGIPMYIPYFALPLSFALITLVQVMNVITRIGMFLRGEEMPEDEIVSEEGSAS